MMVNTNRRSAARLAAVQALYEMEIAGKGLKETCTEFESFWIGREIEGAQYGRAEFSFFSDILAGVVAAQGPVDRIIDKTLAAGWPLARIDSVMRAILRAGTYELKHRADIPVRVSIKEYVDVAGAFFGSEEVGMVNAVLDALAHQCRAAEFEPRAYGK
jgi:transcription antitermination protein NusB